MSEGTRQWCQPSKGQHDTGRKYLCFPPKYVEALRSRNPLRAQLEQIIHQDITIYLPATCIYHGNIFPCDAGKCLPAVELKARDYPSSLMRPHQLLHPVLRSLISRKGIGKWEQIQSANKMVRDTGSIRMCWGTSLSQLREEAILGVLRSHLSLWGGHHDTFWSPSSPEWLHQWKYLYLCWRQRRKGTVIFCRKVFVYV